MDTLEQATIWSQKPYLRLQNPLAKTGRDRTAQWQNENRSTPNPKISRFPLAPSTGGGGRDRTDDLKLAKLALSQLSYAPNAIKPQRWARSVEGGGPGRT